MPLAIDLFTGLHGWAEGLVAEGFDVVGFDVEDMCGQFGVPRPLPLSRHIAATFRSNRLGES